MLRIRLPGPVGVVRLSAIAAAALCIAASAAAGAQDSGTTPIPVVDETIPVQTLREVKPERAKLEAAEPAKLDNIEVTGSRLSRVAMEGALPVVTLTRQDIAASGKISVADALRTTTFNSFGSYTSTSGNSNQGQAIVSLRGLSGARSLVLIDGRRVATSPSLQGTGVDLNTIPLAAVERIEVLSDGASAIYGSDAIGGVVNIILRKDFTGVEIEAGFGSPRNQGGSENSASIVAGVSTGDARMLFGASYTAKDPIYLRDREYSRSNLGDGRNFSTVSGMNGFGNTVFSADYSRTLQPTAAACPSALGFHALNDDLGLFTGIANSPICAFDFTQYAADTTQLDTTSVFVRLGYDLDYDLKFDTTVSYGQSESFGRFAPAPDFLFVPGTLASNPYQEDVYVAHRFLSLGTRDNSNRAGVFNIVSTLRKSFDEIDVEVGASLSRYTYTELGTGYLLRSAAAAAAADGTYNPFDIAKPGEPNVIDSLNVTISRDGLTESREVFTTVKLPLFNLPQGRVDAAFGAEYRQERFYDNYDSQSEAGTVGGSAGNSSDGNRNAYALFAETILPVLEDVEVNLAARYDDYSDVGGEFSPKVSVRWAVLPNLTVRSSLGKGFRAPLLSELNANDQLSAVSARDLVNCRANNLPDVQCPELQYDTFYQANSALKPETSTQFGIGLAVQPFDWMNITLDYYNIEIKDSVTTYTVQSLIFRELLGQPLPEGTQIVRESSGRIDEVFSKTDNIAKITVDGIDMQLNTRFGLGDWGQLRPSLAASYTLGFREDDGVLPARNQTGDAGYPDYRASLEVAWQFENLITTWNTTFIPSTAATLVPGDPNPLDLQQQGHVASNILHDIQVKWDTPWNSSLALGIRDIFDKGVSPNRFLTSPVYDQTLYNPLGRMPYLRFTQRF